MKKFVLARNYKQFKYHFPEPNNDTIYLSDYTQLLGHHNFEIIRIGTWYERDSKFLERVELEENLGKH